MSAQTYGIRARVASGRHGKYQLDVTACDVIDVVRHAGGWLYDRAKGGWDVRVLLSSDGDVTPLRILGLRTERIETEDDPTAPPRALALAASMEALAANSLLREDVLRAMKRGLGEVTLWGDFPGGQERSDPGRQLGGQERSDPGRQLGGQERSDPGRQLGGQERSDPGKHFSASGFDRGVESVEHVLSSAACAFKAHALRAAGLDEAVGAVETFRRKPTAFLVD